MTTLKLENICKRYGKLETVRGVSLQIEAGERVALLGHNGAGKTTLMRMVLGLTSITSGTISILGATPGSRAARTTIGFLPESVAFHGALTGREQLHHFARLKSETLQRADDLLDRVGLSDAADRKLRTYSKGMRQRVGLAQALLGRPLLALLDEPTSGLDPISRHEFYNIVEELAASGTAVLFSSHALTELENHTDRIAILSKGMLLADNNLVALRQTARLPIHLYVTTSEADTDRIAAELGGKRVNGRSIALTCQQDGKIAMLGQIASMGAAIKDVDVTPANLEDLYRFYTVNGEGM